MKAMLTGEQEGAIKAAAERIDDTGLCYVLMVFDHEGVGAVFSNIEPFQAVKGIEGALKAAKAQVDTGILQ